jgi:hypothetical protein
MGMYTKLALLVSNISHTTTYNIMQYLKDEIIMLKYRICISSLSSILGLILQMKKSIAQVQLYSAFWRHIISMNILSKMKKYYAYSLRWDKSYI